VARRYLQLSHAKLFKFGGGREFQDRKEWLDGRITLLQDAGISPQAPPDVAPPPEAPYSQCLKDAKKRFR
jgi:hypothetical protein